VILTPLFSISQQYHPFPEQNAYWTVVEFNQQFSYWDTYIYTVKGDTVLNDKPYKKIWQLDNIPSTNDTLWVLHSFMRQDTLQKKVWFIRHYMNETTEKLGYDFDVQIGDTVYLPAFDYENSGDSGFILINPLWDSTLLHNGEYRKNYFYANLNHDIGLDPYVIEGVGTQRTPFPNLFYFDPFHQSELVCHKVNGVYLYGADPLPEECDFTVNINEIMPLTTVIVKPNPCNSYVEIQFPENLNTEMKIELVNSIGETFFQKSILLHQKEVRINTTSFNNGLYILRTNTKNGNFFINKIIINH
jgi:hypothetical protein